MTKLVPKPAVRVDGVSKVFRVYPKPSDMLWETFSRKPRHTEFHALSDISVEIGHGHVVGRMGQNGAGKSTLLKVLAGTLTPSLGSVAVDGRVSAILELGTGFNPNFSGRENIVMGGLCAGFSHKQITEQMDEIIDFAELRSVIDQPFRTYSTGMQARLSFSTVIVANPDLLIVDEALSVGDARFQLRSFDKFQDFKARGKTIILVSHSSNVITSFCDRAILLDRGRVVADGDPNLVAKTYHKLLFGGEQVSVPSRPAPQPLPAPAQPPASASAIRIVPEAVEPAAEIAPLLGSRVGAADRYGNKMAEVVDLKIFDEHGRPTIVATSCATYRIVAHIRVNEPLDSLCCGFLIRDPRGTDLFGIDTVTAGLKGAIPIPGPGEIIEVDLAIVMAFAAGTFFLTIGVAGEDGLKYDMWFDALQFQVLPTADLYHASIVNLQPQFDFRVPGAPSIESRAS